jgi:hypothetical protein
MPGEGGTDQADGDRSQGRHEKLLYSPFRKVRAQVDINPLWRGGNPAWVGHADVAGGLESSLGRAGFFAE